MVTVVQIPEQFFGPASAHGHVTLAPPIALISHSHRCLLIPAAVYA